MKRKRKKKEKSNLKGIFSPEIEAQKVSQVVYHHFHGEYRFIFVVYKFFFFIMDDDDLLLN